MKHPDPAVRAAGLIPKLALAAISLVLCLIGGELIGRLVWGAPTFLDERVLFVSSNTWHRSDTAAVRYSPSRVVRVVAIYGNNIEYDVSFSVNDLGFIDHRDYEADYGEVKQTRIALVGDSFTAGIHGGDPWVPRLRDRAVLLHPEVEIYNLGIGATGIQDFALLVESLEREDLRFDRIVFILISHDVARYQWRPIEHEGSLHLCRLGTPAADCLRSPSRILVLQNNEEPTAALLERARRSGLIRPPRTGLEWLRRHTFIGARLGSIIAPITLEAVRPSLVEFVDQHRFARRWLDRLKSRFPDKGITILQLPQKHELEDRQLDLDLAEDVRRAGFVYISLMERCNLRVDDYFEFDTHLNQRGYDKLLACVGKALDLL